MFARPDGARRSNPAERTATSPKLPPPQAASFNGGTRPLGIPTVGDRVAQTVVKMVLEPMVEPSFHPDSYGYRPGRSAIDAVAMTRKRCWGADWVFGGPFFVIHFPLFG